MEESEPFLDYSYLPSLLSLMKMEYPAAAIKNTSNWTIMSAMM